MLRCTCNYWMDKVYYPMRGGGVGEDLKGEHCLVVKKIKTHPEWFLFARPQFSSVLRFLIELNNQTHHWWLFVYQALFWRVALFWQHVEKLWPLHFSGHNFILLGCLFNNHQVVIIKFQRLSACQQQELALTALEAGRLRSRFWETQCLVRACFLVQRLEAASHGVLLGWRGWGLWGLFSGDTSPIHEGSALPPNCLLKVSPPDTLTLGIRFQWMNVGVEDILPERHTQVFANSGLKRLPRRVLNTRASPLLH